jgi:predicted nucleic acid-binding protein
MAVLVPLFQRVQRGELRVIVSVITESELLVRPRRYGDTEAEERVQDLLSEDGFNIVPVDRITARLAADIRARHNLALADAIILATGIATGCEAVVSNDGKWSRVAEIAFVRLDEVIGNV